MNIISSGVLSSVCTVVEVPRLTELAHLRVGTGFFLVFMGFLSLIFFVCAFRTNVCFVVIFLTLVLTFAFLTVAYWLLAEDFTGNASTANDFVIVSLILQATARELGCLEKLGETDKC